MRPAVVVAEDAPEELTWQQWIARQFTGDEGAGLGISLVLHLMLIAMLAIPIIREVQSGALVTTVTESADDDFNLSALLDTEDPSSPRHFRQCYRQSAMRDRVRRIDYVRQPPR